MFQTSPTPTISTKNNGAADKKVASRASFESSSTVKFRRLPYGQPPEFFCICLFLKSIPDLSLFFSSANCSAGRQTEKRTDTDLNGHKRNASYGGRKFRNRPHMSVQPPSSVLPGNGGEFFKKTFTKFVICKLLMYIIAPILYIGNEKLVNHQTPGRAENCVEESAATQRKEVQNG